MFSDSTFALGVTSLVVCILVTCCLVAYERIVLRPPTVLEVVSMALVFAGGIGNAIDRFCQGYVVDLIRLTFIDFPVFNVADIGVTCGFVLLFLSLLMYGRNNPASEQ